MSNKVELIIGGKEYNANVGIGFLEKITKEEGKSLQEVFAGFNQDAAFLIPKMIAHAINYQQEREGKTVIHLADVYDHIDENGYEDEQVTKFIQAFSDAVTAIFPQESGKQNAVKAARKA